MSVNKGADLAPTHTKLEGDGRRDPELRLRLRLWHGFEIDPNL
jgi:hypothetical protein